MRHLLFLFMFLPVFLPAQEELSQLWAFESINDTSGTQLLPVDTADYFYLKDDGSFIYELKAKNDLLAQGTWTLNDVS